MNQYKEVKRLSKPDEKVKVTDGESWERTDSLQFVQKLSESEFNVIEITQYPDNSFVFQYFTIDVSKYEEEKIQELVNAYGYEFENGILLQGGIPVEGPISHNQLIAEIIAEMSTREEANESYSCDNVEEINQHLVKYGIVEKVEEGDI